jgi:hypothetical protein
VVLQNGFVSQGGPSCMVYVSQGVLQNGLLVKVVPHVRVWFRLAKVFLQNVFVSQGGPACMV